MGSSATQFTGMSDAVYEKFSISGITEVDPVHFMNRGGLKFLVQRDRFEAESL